MLPQLSFLISIISIFLFTPIIYARTTPADIVNEERQVYNQKVKNYSALNQKRLESLSKKIADLNKEKTKYLENLILKQGEILDEYVKRFNIKEEGGRDGITRSSDPVAVVRIEITRAHESVAYQAAKIYIPSLSGQTNIKPDSLSLVNRLQYDMNLVRKSAIYSQNLLENLLKKNAY